MRGSSDVGELREAYWRYIGEGSGDRGKYTWSADCMVRDNLGSCFSLPLPLPAACEKGGGGTLQSVVFFTIDTMDMRGIMYTQGFVTYLNHSQLVKIQCI